jgi:hypothetical protein
LFESYKVEGRENQVFVIKNPLWISIIIQKGYVSKYIIKPYKDYFQVFQS